MLFLKSFLCLFLYHWYENASNPKVFSNKFDCRSKSSGIVTAKKNQSKMIDKRTKGMIMMEEQYLQVMTIAGSDSDSSAGMQTDMHTFLLEAFMVSL